MVPGAPLSKVSDAGNQGHATAADDAAEKGGISGRSPSSSSTANGRGASKEDTRQVSGQSDAAIELGPLEEQGGAVKKGAKKQNLGWFFNTQKDRE